MLNVLMQPFPSHSMTCLRRKYPGVLTRLPCWLALTAGNHPGQPSPHPYSRFLIGIFLFSSLIFLLRCDYLLLPCLYRVFSVQFFLLGCSIYTGYYPIVLFFLELSSLDFLHSTGCSSILGCLNL